MRGIPIRHGAIRGPAGEDVGFEQSLSKRLCELLFAPRMRNPARKAFAFGMYAGISKPVVFISGLDGPARWGNGCGTEAAAAAAAVFAMVIGVKFDSGETIPATVFSAGSAARQHVLQKAMYSDGLPSVNSRGW